MVSVFAAPGVALPEPAMRSVDAAVLRGWRRAVWPLDEDLVLELDPPAATFRVATIEVCCDMPDELRSMVRSIMVDQLHVALAFGESSSRELVVDEEARARQASVSWILTELREAFPDEVWELPQPSMLPAVIPDTPDELLALLPVSACVSVEIVVDTNMIMRGGEANPPVKVREAFILLVSLVFEHVARVCVGVHYPHLLEAAAPQKTPPEQARPVSLTAHV